MVIVVEVIVEVVEVLQKCYYIWFPDETPILFSGSLVGFRFLGYVTRSRATVDVAAV